MPIPSFHPGRLALATLLLVTAACADSPVATNTPADGPIALIVVSGDAQSAPANTELPAPLVVRVTDVEGHRVKDQVVNFRVVQGGGSVYGGASLTNKDGIAQDWWTLGPSGAQVVEVRAVDPKSGEKQLFATFNATIAVPPPPAIAPDSYEPNDFQGQGILSPLPLNNGQSFTVQANFHTLADVDWYRFGTNDSGASCFPGTSEDFRVIVTLGNVPAGAQYQVALYEGITLRASGTTGFVFAYRGICGANDDKAFTLQVSRIVGDATANLYNLVIAYTDSEP